MELRILLLFSIVFYVYADSLTAYDFVTAE